jgi:cell division GTPase FtsZ/glycosyltransferase involved in cell wall biosynthesis
LIDQIKNKTVIIKTYLTESGLFYLAESAARVLQSNGNKVIFIPKEKYAKNNQGSFYRYYPNLSEQIKKTPWIKEGFSDKVSIETETIRVVEKYKANIIISFETFIQDSRWVEAVKKKFGTPVIDVPMPEWVKPSQIQSSYKIFNQIWCLTESCYKAFSAYPTRKLVTWDFVDRSIFEPKKDKTKIQTLTFYHPGPVSPGFNQKNTLVTLQAYSKFCEDNPNSKLILTGRLTPEELAIVQKCTNIQYNNRVLSRGEISEFYDQSHCVIAPSQREGLGLCFWEAKAMGCELISIDAPPMSEHTSYLASVTHFEGNDSIIPFAKTSSDLLYQQIRKYYEDFIMSNEVKKIEIVKKKKTPEQIAQENAALLAAFEEPAIVEEPRKESSMDPEVLKKLRSKLDVQKAEEAQVVHQEEDEVPVVNKATVSIEMAIVGVGQAGSRIAEVFYKKGYDTAVLNTSAQDLEFIEVPDRYKLLLEGSLGGTGKDLDLGREIFNKNQVLISDLVEEVVDGNHMVYLAISGGGGTGSSSVDTLVPLLFNTGLPVGVIYVLPKATEDAQSKKNSIETLSRLAKMTTDNMISNLIVVDNARIEHIYANLSQSKFWEAANEAIVEPLHVFNSLTSTPSRFTSLDPSDFGKIISTGDCSIYGVMEVEDYMEETALAEAVIQSLSSNMLASGFDISQARTGGVIITGSKEVLDRLPALNINYCFHMISEQTNGASIFQGVYDVESDEDSVKIYSWFAGLGLPKDRIEGLKRESQAQAAIASQKEKNRSMAMSIDMEEDDTNSLSREINRKIKNKTSSFSKLQVGSRESIIDKRRGR